MQGSNSICFLFFYAQICGIRMKFILFSYSVENVVELNLE